MGLATINPHSQKEHTEIYKIPLKTFLTEIQAFKNVKNLQINVSKCRQTAMSGFVRISIHFFVNQSIGANPIIYRLVRSPSRYEISQEPSGVAACFQND